MNMELLGIILTQPGLHLLQDFIIIRLLAQIQCSCSFKYVYIRLLRVKKSYINRKITLAIPGINCGVFPDPAQVLRRVTAGLLFALTFLILFFATKAQRHKAKR